jgi:tetratricopeptide (TPR) repeat protein
MEKVNQRRGIHSQPQNCTLWFDCAQHPSQTIPSEVEGQGAGRIWLLSINFRPNIAFRPEKLIKFSLIYFIILFSPLFLNISYIYAGKAKDISGDAESYRTKGYEAQQRGDIDTAIEWYQKAASLKPEYASPHNDLGILFETKGWLDRAEAEYKKALAIDPGYKEVHTNLALLYERKGELEKATFHWMKRYRLGSLEDPWTQEAKNRLEKLGLLDKTEKESQKTEQQVAVKKSQEKEKPITKEIPAQKLPEKKQEPEPKAKKDSEWTRIGPEKKVEEGLKPSPTKSKKTLDAELQESLKLAEERLKKEIPAQKLPEKKQEPEPKAKKDSEWTRIGPEKKVEESLKPSPTKSKKTLDAELQESLKLAEERLKKERRSTEDETKQPDKRVTASSEPNVSYNKAKDYYNKGEYTKALDTIRLAKQKSSENKQLSELEEEIKFKMKEERIEDYYKEGMIHYRQKDFAGARKEFEAILNILPE